ncbi:MAG: GGDEF domain-containing protein [Firmicutes bacterium]|nr:GGDEF domain-containing protein [Bacillota bacterium]
MIRKVKDIMVRDFIKIDALCRVGRIQEIALEKGYDCFPVVEGDRIIGVLTTQELIKAHSNRIAADAVSNKYEVISLDANLWTAEEIIKQKKINILLVKEDEEICGIITKHLLDAELGKHVDLLTGLYRSDYIYYKAVELVKEDMDFSIIFLDINNFGHINKTYGHVKGDIILQEVSILLKKSIPSDAYLCRFAGDEFIVLIPYNIKDSISIANKLVDVVLCHKFQNNILVTISAGIAGKNKYNIKLHSAYSVVTNIINTASLASSKAKAEKSKISIAGNFKSDEIA